MPYLDPIHLLDTSDLLIEFLFFYGFNATKEDGNVYVVFEDNENMELEAANVSLLLCDAKINFTDYYQSNSRLKIVVSYTPRELLQLIFQHLY